MVEAKVTKAFQGTHSQLRLLHLGAPGQGLGLMLRIIIPPPISLNLALLLTMAATLCTVAVLCLVAVAVSMLEDLMLCLDD